ncbi:MAG: glycosyltransferase family A protein [Anaerolineae bacterium]|jgi:glycosyltransferase involved in cell wall biosynthesis|nr:glycosyltransferase family A protein [Anaerolineae bacterium]
MSETPSELGHNLERPALIFTVVDRDKRELMAKQDSGSDQALKFTVIIPTRERCDTLLWTLRTCTNQDYDALEILVSDNFSQDDTRDVVDSFKDPRIRYVSTGKRLSMSHNWEFALSHVDEGYVTFVGDDDGLLPGAISELNTLIQQLGGPEALSWQKADYSWPDAMFENQRNYLLIPLSRRLMQYNARQALQNVADFDAAGWKFPRFYNNLPCLYNSVVSMTAIRRAQDASGKFFHSRIPDAYSAIALSCVLDTYYYSFKPYSVNGTSHHSGGSSYFSAGDQDAAANKFLEEENLPFHNDLVMAPSIPILTAEAFFQARDHLAPEVVPPPVDIKKVVRRALLEAIHASSGVIYDRVVEALQEIGRHYGIEADVMSQIAQSPYQPVPATEPVTGYRIPLQCLGMFCDDFGVQNVYDASLICKYTLDLQRDKPMTWLNIAKTNLTLAPDYLKRLWCRITRR